LSAVQAQRVRGHGANVNRGSLIGIRPDVQADARFPFAKVAQKHIHAVELCVGRDAVDFVDQLGYFHLDLLAVFRAVDAVSGLYGQFADAVQDVLGFLKVSFSGLDERNAVLDVPFRLVQPTDLTAHFFGHGQTGSVVAGFVDSHAGRQFFDIGFDVRGFAAQRPVGVHSAHVVIDDHMTLLDA